MFFWFLMCVGIGFFAKSRGRSTWGWGLAAVFISPLLAGIALALMKDMSQARDVNKVEMEQERLKERVAINEIQVNKRFDNVEKQIESIKTENKRLGAQAKNKMLDEGNKICPNCGETIKKAAVKCKFCGSDVEEHKMQECPYCKELIRADATKCKFCRGDLLEFKSQQKAKNNNWEHEELAENEVITNDMGQPLCPNCHVVVPAGARFCPSCGVKVGKE